MKIKGNKVWDRSRAMWVTLTPEEHVRQWFIDLIVGKFGVSPALVATEYALHIGGRTLRADVAIFAPSTTTVHAVVECKAPSVALDQSTMRQAAVYNSVLGARYVIVTNGTETFAYDGSSEKFVNDLSLIFLFGDLIN